jgi:lambda family phage portal protein
MREPITSNMADRVVEWLNPVGALRRRHARLALAITNSGYSHGGASSSKTSMKGWTWRGGDAKTDIELNLPTLRQRSRDLYMNSGIARAALGRLQTNVIGTGLRLRALPDAEVLGMDRDKASEWARRVEREWALWAESRDCDGMGLNTFDELQQIAFISWLHSGDAIALLPLRPLPWASSDLRIDLIEADRVSTPRDMSSDPLLHDGVETDESGRVIAYHICNMHPLGMGSAGGAKQEWVKIPARGSVTGRYNVLHLMAGERCAQYRGVPILAPVIESCKQLSRYHEAELMAAVIAAFYTVFIKSETPQNPLGEAFVDETAAEQESGQSTQDTENQLGLGNGAVLALNPGEDISIANPGRPNAAFEGFVNAVSREIGAAINVPSELLLLQFTSSYSASRAALLEAWKGFRMWRRWMSVDFCQPIYTEWLTLAVLTGRIEAPGMLEDPLIAQAWTRAEWNGPAAGQIDPMKEVQAATMRVEQGFSTRTRETAEMTGGDYEANIDSLADEQARREQAGVVHGSPAPVAPDPATLDPTQQ